MKKIILLIALFLASAFCFGQKMCIVDNRYDCDYKIYITPSCYEADLYVNIADNRNAVKDDINSGIWYVTRNRYNCDYKIYFVKDKYDADLVIYFVASKYQAGAKKQIKKK